MDSVTNISDKVEDVQSLLAYAECPGCGNKTLPTFKCVPCKVCGFNTCGM